MGVWFEMLRNFFTVILSFLSGYYRCITGELTLFCLQKFLCKSLLVDIRLNIGGVPVKFITLTNSVFWLEFSLITWQKLFIAILVKASSLE